MSKKILLSFLGLMLCMAANAAYVVNWPIYGDVAVEDYYLADDNTTVTDQDDAYYCYQYSPLLRIAALRCIFPSNASGERDFVLVPTYIIVDGVAYHVIGVSGTLLGNDANTIRNIYLNDELEFLGTRALYNAIAVSDLTIPASVKAVSYDIFNGMSSGAAIRTLTFADSSEPLTIDGAYSSGSMIIANLPLTTLHLGRTFAGNSYGTTGGSTLQQTLVNLTVGGQGTEVNPDMFKEFKNLTNVTFNAGVGSIGANAFEKCLKLTSVTMSAVARIGDYAFASDSLMTTLSLGEGVRYIGDYAFYKVKQIPSLTLPASLDSLHMRAFVGMTGVQSLTIADSDRPLMLFGSGEGFYGSSLASHMTALKTAYVGRNITPTPHDYRITTAFYEAPLKRLTVGDHVTAIGANDFYGCQQLEQVQLGSNLSSIGEKAFYGNTSLRAITIPDRVTTISSEAFSGDSAMATLNLGAGVRYIYDYAFNGCKQVISLTLPASLDSLHMRAFVGMTGVQSLTIADSDRPLKLFGSGEGFYGSSLASQMTALKTAYVGRNITPTPHDYRITTAFYEAPMKRLTVGDHVTAIGANDFYGCQQLEQVQLGSNLSSIGEKAFYGNTSLRAITIPDRVTTISSKAFSGDSAMTTLNLGAGVRYIYDYAFNGCKQVTSLTLPASLDSVHMCAFAGMTGVQSLTIADTDRPLKLFGSGDGFYGSSLASQMTALETAYMGRNIIPTPHDYRKTTAFYEATMAQLTLGKKVTALSADEFHGCANLVLINSLNTTPPVCANSTTFDGVDKTACALHVPQGCKPAYQGAPVWRDFYGMVDDLPNDNPSTPGDLSGDGVVNGNDLNILINIILGKDDAANYGGRANVDGQGGVDGSDMNALINILLGK